MQRAASRSLHGLCIGRSAVGIDGQSGGLVGVDSSVVDQGEVAITDGSRALYGLVVGESAAARKDVIGEVGHRDRAGTVESSTSGDHKFGVIAAALKVNGAIVGDGSRAKFEAVVVGNVQSAAARNRHAGERWRVPTVPDVNTLKHAARTGS